MAYSHVFKKMTPKSHFISSAHILLAGLNLITTLRNEGAGWLVVRGYSDISLSKAKQENG